MSIASEITRITNAKAVLKDAIVARGVEVADSLKLDDYAKKVSEIPSVGEFFSNSLYGKIKTAEEILNSLDFSLVNFTKEDAFVLFYIGKVQAGIKFYYGNKNAFVNGEIYNFNTPKTFEGGYNYVVINVFTDTSNRLAIPVGYASFVYTRSSGAYGLEMNDQNKRTVVYAPNAKLTCTSVYGAGNYFNNVYCNEIVVRHGQYGRWECNVFVGDGKMIFDNSSGGYANAVSMAIMQEFPRRSTFGYSVNFSKMVYISPDTFAVFDESGSNIVDGFVLGAEKSIDTAITLTFSNSLKGCYTSDQVAKIEDTLNTKGFSVAWAD